MRMAQKVLIIDDMEDIHWVIGEMLKSEGYLPLSARNGREAIEKIEKTYPDAVLLDIRMPEMDGIELLKEFRKRRWRIPVIVLTAFGEIPGAVEAMKLGAYDYLVKPFENQEVLLRVQRALKERELQEELNTLKSQLDERATFSELMGSSDAMKKVFEQIRCVANTDFTVVLYGETGSGKELVAKAIHNLSPRRDKNFVVVDCGSIPEHLLESELFGHEKGAFTSAYTTKEGQFELAKGGTVLLDEIGNLPLLMQNKLLRVLQEKCIRRVGGKHDIKVDIRVIVAGNERLEDLLAQNRFRRDLYYRLNEFTIEIPSLEERKDDILLLSQHFLKLTNKELNKEIRGFTEAAVERLLSYSWPGNVRELKNVIRRAILLAADNDSIEPKHLLLSKSETCYDQPPPSHGTRFDEEGCSLWEIVKKAVRDVESKTILETLKRVGGNKSKAAKLLKIDYSTLHYKIKQYGLRQFNGTGDGCPQGEE